MRQAEESASEEARRTGTTVPIPELTTETDTVVAKPEGGFTLTRTSSPERVKRGGDWVDLDATLSKDSSGAITPAASWSGLKLSAGGNGPLAKLNRNGKELAFTWPTPLPVPVLDGASAVYPNVLPDVDLRVTAGTLGGFTHTLVVKNATAARNPGLATLRLGVVTAGLTVAAGDDGALQAVDPSGAPVFTAPPATMWDSRTTPPTDAPAKAVAPAPAPVSASQDSPPDSPVPGAESSTADGPGAYAEHTELPVAVAANSLTLTPDQGMLDDPDTVFPVYIDPTWNPNPGVGSTWTQAGCPTATNWSASKDPGVGYQQYNDGSPSCIGNQRAYYQFNGGFSANRRTVTGIEFDATETYSSNWDCDKKYPVALWSIPGTIGPGTNWNNRPEGGNDANRTWVASMDMAGAKNNGGTPCSKLLADYTIGSQYFAMMLDRLDDAVVTFSLTGKENVADDQFKRFGRNAALRVHYNSWVNDPADLQVQPTPQNPACGGWIGAVNPAGGGIKLSAVISDPDNSAVTANFHLWDATSGPTLTDYGWGPWLGNGSRAEVAVGTLTDGHRYDWYVRAGDGDGRSDSPFIRGCSFGVDRTPPTVPTVTSTQYPPSGSTPGSTLHVGDPGTFTIASTDPPPGAGSGSGVDKFEYAINDSIAVGGANTVDANGSGGAAINFTPTWWGTNILYVQAVDHAGNRSQPRAYSFYVPFDPNRTSVAGDITGDRLPDLLLPDAAGNLVMHETRKDAAAPASSTLVSLAADAPDNNDTAKDGKAWTTALLSHTTSTGNWTDDIWAYKAGKLQLYRHSNNPALPPENRGLPNNGNQYFAANNRVDPVVKQPWLCTVGDCTTYAPEDWSRTRSLAAIHVPAAGGDAARTDLLVVEDDDGAPGGTASLWHYKGGFTPGELVAARKIGTGWQDYTLTAPGDATGDGLPDLWARNSVTGDLFQYPSARNADNTFNPGNLGSGSARVRIRTDMTAQKFPLIVSDGNITGSSHPDLWAMSPDGRVTVFPGRVPADGNAFDEGVPFVYSTASWSTCEAISGQQLCGPLLAKYRSLPAGLQTAFGLPISGVLNTADGRSKYVNLTNNTSLHWTPLYGTFYVNGAVRTQWGATGWNNGSLGYPKSDEYDVAGGRRSDFEGGYIRWTQSTNTAADHTYAAGETPTAHISVAGDFNGDGRTDLATVVDYQGGSAALWTSLTTPTGGSNRPFESWKTGAGNWWITSAKWVSGDFNNDGRDDVAALYRYGDGRVKLHTFTARTDGGFNNPAGSWEQAAGWDWARTTLMAGNADGTGADELVAVQGTADGRYATYTFTATATGTFNAPVKGFEETHPGWWSTDQSHFALGDANGDGRADVIGAYIYGDHTLKTFTALANTNGTYPAFAVAGWASAANAWWHNAMQVTAGDINGDGRADLIVEYDYGDGIMGLWTFAANTSGNLTTPVQGHRSDSTGDWYAANSVPHAGDTNGDGRADVITLYNYGNSSFAGFVFTAKTGDPNDSLNTGVATWRAPVGTW